jgi:hypothetical protein
MREPCDHTTDTISRSTNVNPSQPFLKTEPGQWHCMEENSDGEN